jgi:hypothetical protein
MYLPKNDNGSKISSYEGGNILGIGNYTKASNSYTQMKKNSQNTMVGSSLNTNKDSVRFDSTSL